MRTSAFRRAGLLLFLGLVTGVGAALPVVVNHLSQLGARGRVVAVGLSLDLLVLVPLAFYVLIVRPRALPLVTVVPVVVFGALVTSQVLPAEHHQVLRVVEALLVPAELAVIGWIAWRSVTVLRASRRDAAADPLARLQRAAFELTHSERLAGVLASELAVLWYVLGSWWARPHAPAGTTAFSCHRRSAHGVIVTAFLLALTVEGLAVHVLLLYWSRLAAWIFTASTAYVALWLIADWRATVLRPVLVRDDGILVRAGLRLTLLVPFARLAHVGTSKPDHGKQSVNLTILGTPTHWLTLSEPMLGEGPYGFRRRVRAVGIQPDAGDDFDRVLRPLADR